ncbi:4-hydroxy-tetrahydrodipicolinate synthase [Salininema proteolyticum]|uniref:4-hydroxy-tetrahydrodipicolinate synthase n=1 Tax=Salininema proteolyticum TaxID=1607685 RepID=A0ABV8U2A0_9ACTN
MRNVTRPFGRTLTAMITPFTRSGELDADGSAELARYLVDEQGCDGLVLNGTTGESPTTTDAEKIQLIETVVDAVGDRAHILAGTSNYNTRHSVEQAKSAEKAGANGLLLVTPFYSLPPQDGIAAHFTAIADATELPVMLYDIPGRSGMGIALDTYGELVKHPRVIAVKDATHNLAFSQYVRNRTGITVYCGVDPLNLAAYSTGAVGVVSVIGHLFGRHINAMFDAYDQGEVEKALAISDALQPALEALQGGVQGVIAVKAALALKGLPGGEPRLPLTPADDAIVDLIKNNLAEVEEIL